MFTKAKALQKDVIRSLTSRSHEQQVKRTGGEHAGDYKRTKIVYLSKGHPWRIGPSRLLAIRAARYFRMAEP
jgi:hypothetical protein